MNYDYQSLRNHMSGMKYETWQEQEQFHQHICDYYSSHIPMVGDEDDELFLYENGLDIDDFFSYEDD